MAKVELELNDATLERARRLAEARHATLDTLVNDVLDQTTALAASDPLLGLFSEEPDEVSVDLNRLERPAIVPNEKMLSILSEIQERHKDRPSIDGSDTLRLIHEARAGAMYDCDPTE
jgi:hypothetical protein